MIDDCAHQIPLLHNNHRLPCFSVFVVTFWSFFFLPKLAWTEKRDQKNLANAEIEHNYNFFFKDGFSSLQRIFIKVRMLEFSQSVDIGMD